VEEFEGSEVLGDGEVGVVEVFDYGVVEGVVELVFVTFTIGMFCVTVVFVTLIVWMLESEIFKASVTLVNLIV
jgi:hypothetical protein